MRIRITFDLGEHQRRAIGNFYGCPIADHAMCKRFIEDCAFADIQSEEADLDAQVETEDDDARLT